MSASMIEQHPCITIAASSGGSGGNSYARFYIAAPISVQRQVYTTKGLHNIKPDILTSQQAVREAAQPSLSMQQPSERGTPARGT